MNELLTRNATVSDMNEIKSIYNEARSFGKSSGSCDWSDDYPNDLMIKDDINHSYLYIVYINDNPIALFSLIDTDDLDNEPLDWTPVKSGVPARICIKPQLQGKGFGKMIMHELIKIAGIKGYQSLRLLASTSNEPANKLYRALNFSNKGIVKLYHKEFTAYELLLQ